MSQSYRFHKKFRVSSEEKREVEINLPAYRKYYGEDTTWYVKLYANSDGQLCDVTISVTSGGVSYSGTPINKTFEIEFENPHRFGYSYDFYMGLNGESKIIEESEYTKIVAQIMVELLKILGINT